MKTEGKWRKANRKMTMKKGKKQTEKEENEKKKRRKANRKRREERKKWGKSTVQFLLVHKLTERKKDREREERMF